MPNKLTSSRSETALARVLDVFERELLLASDEEIMAAAAELGMKPAMKGSGAFTDIKYAGALKCMTTEYANWLGANADPARMDWTFRTRPSADSPQPNPSKPKPSKASRQRKL